MPVGLVPGAASPCGALDMSGSVFHWTRSLSGATHRYPYQPARDEDLDSSHAVRVLRGGSLGRAKNFLRVTSRVPAGVNMALPVLGFRVVFSPS
jgi:formylglycine-generating enzyme required for sulfatase activity